MQSGGLGVMTPGFILGLNHNFYQLTIEQAKLVASSIANLIQWQQMIKEGATQLLRSYVKAPVGTIRLSTYEGDSTS